MHNSLDHCKNFLEKLTPPETLHCVCGFDGFVDTLVRPVRQAHLSGHDRYFPTIQSFGEYLVGKGGKSCSISLEAIRTSFGGNAPILSSAMASLGVTVCCVGAMGYPTEDEVFAQMNPRCQRISVAKPGYANALEFDDGKIILTQNTAIEQIGYADIENAMGTDALMDKLENCHGAALVNWGEIVAMHKLWETVLEKLQKRGNPFARKPLLVDFADCSARSTQEILDVMALMGQFNQLFDVCVSVNLNEFQTLCRAAGIEPLLDAEHSRQLQARLGVTTLVIHTLKDAFWVQGEANVFVQSSGRHVQKPVISTGGGDHFNAGLLTALMAGATPEDALVLANATAGSFVSQGKSPSLPDIILFLEQWRASL